MNNQAFQAVMLAAGRGTRLAEDGPALPPKCLMQFDGKSLLERHLEVLSQFGIDRLKLVVGYRSDEIFAELDRLGVGDRVMPIKNPDFHRGSGVSLWHAKKVLRQGEPVLFMDADVLYHPDLIARLLIATGKTVVPYDPSFEAGEEPVKICIEAGRVVEFSKILPDTLSYETIGEWPGFMVIGGDAGPAIAKGLQQRIDAGHLDFPYEDAMRQVLLEAPADGLALVDVADIPWIEIDFPEDVERAKTDILPAIEAGYTR